MKSFNFNTYEVLDRIGVPDASKIPQLIDGLKRAENFQRAAFCDVLAGIGAAAIPALTELLLDSDPDIRWHGVQGLCKIEGAPDATTPALISALGHGDESIRVTAALGLSKYNAAADAAVPLLIQSLQAMRSPDPDSDELDDDYAKQEFVIALGAFSPPTDDALRELIQALDDQSVNVRTMAVEALGKHGPKAIAATERLRILAHQAVPPYPTESADSSSLQAWRNLFDGLALAALRALARIAGERHEDVLVRLIKDSRTASWNQGNAIEALGEEPFGAEAHEALRKIANESTNPYLQRVAEAALKRSGDDGGTS